MPNAAPSRCTQHCGRFATHKGRCEEHQRKPWENKSQHTLQIDKATWNRVSREHRRIEPTCRVCGTTNGLTVDHITEIADGGALYDHGNLQTLCRQHHREKTEQAKKLRAARDAEG